MCTKHSWFWLTPDRVSYSSSSRSPWRLVRIMNDSFDPFYRVSMYSNSLSSSIANNCCLCFCASWREGADVLWPAGHTACQRECARHRSGRQSAVFGSPKRRIQLTMFSCGRHRFLSWMSNGNFTNSNPHFSCCCFFFFLVLDEKQTLFFVPTVNILSITHTFEHTIP